MKSVLLTDDQHALMLGVLNARVIAVAKNFPPALEDETTLLAAFTSAKDVPDCANGRVPPEHEVESAAADAMVDPLFGLRELHGTPEFYVELAALVERFPDVLKGLSHGERAASAVILDRIDVLSPGDNIIGAIVRIIDDLPLVLRAYELRTGCTLNLVDTWVKWKE
jgi:hypothetical protein